MQFDKGYVSPYFVTNAEKMSVEFDNARSLFTDKKLSTQKNCPYSRKSQWQKVAASYFIIAEDVDGEALATLVVNKVKGGCLFARLKLLDSAIAVKRCWKILRFSLGRKLISDELGFNIEEVGFDVLGKLKRSKSPKKRRLL